MGGLDMYLVGWPAMYLVGWPTVLAFTDLRRFLGHWTFSFLTGTSQENQKSLLPYDYY